MQALNKVFQQKERLFHATFIKRRGHNSKTGHKKPSIFQKRGTITRILHAATTLSQCKHKPPYYLHFIKIKAQT